MYVEELRFSGRSGGKFNRTVIEGPSWNRISDALNALDQQNVCRVELLNIEEWVIMVISGGVGQYHLGIVEKEARFYYYWNGSKQTNEKVLINEAAGGDYFPKHQIATDLQVVKAIAKEFFETGQMLKTVNWIKYG